jgi:hypothetical protein
MISLTGSSETVENTFWSAQATMESLSSRFRTALRLQLGLILQDLELRETPPLSWYKMAVKLAWTETILRLICRVVAIQLPLRFHFRFLQIRAAFARANPDAVGACVGQEWFRSKLLGSIYSDECSSVIVRYFERIRLRKGCEVSVLPRWTIPSFSRVVQKFDSKLGFDSMQQIDIGNSERELRIPHNLRISLMNWI